MNRKSNIVYNVIILACTVGLAITVVALANNTYYADIVCDHVPLERIAAHAPARLAVVYHSEVPMGASFTLLRAQTGENGWYFVGTDGEKKHFEANLTLTE